MTAEIKGLLQKEKWSFNYKTSKSIFSFSFAGKELFESEGVGLGIIKETSGLTKAVRPHFSGKTNDCSVDSEIILPFGSEPKISRKCEHSANHFRVTTDISIRSKIAVDSISLDSLMIKGEWKEIEIYSQKSSESAEIQKQIFTIEKMSSKGLCFETLPIAVVFRDENGIELEIGSGYDLWRWRNALRFNAKSCFSIKKQKDYFLFERKPFIWDSDYEISKFNFRFTWYFACRKTDTEKDGGKLLSPKRKTESLEIRNNKLLPSSKNFSSLANIVLSDDWPESASSSEGYPCFTSRQTEKLLKDFLRSTMSNNLKEKEKNLTLRGIRPQLCAKASHLERAKEERFLHWDYFYIMAFYEWANRFFSSSGRKFHIALSSESVLSDLPSAFGLEKL